jgi:hypothetical protein
MTSPLPTEAEAAPIEGWKTQTGLLVLPECATPEEARKYGWTALIALPQAAPIMQASEPVSVVKMIQEHGLEKVYNAARQVLYPSTNEVKPDSTTNGEKA